MVEIGSDEQLYQFSAEVQAEIYKKQHRQNLSEIECQVYQVKNRNWWNDRAKEYRIDKSNEINESEIFGKWIKNVFMFSQAVFD